MFQAILIRNLVKENNSISWHHWSMLQLFMVFQKNTKTCWLIAMECIWKWITIVLAISCQLSMISEIPKLKRISKPPMCSMIRAMTKMLLVTLVFWKMLLSQGKFNPYWQILENSSKFFSEISVFWGLWHRRISRKLIQYFSKILIFGAWAGPISGKFIHQFFVSTYSVCVKYLGMS